MTIVPRRDDGARPYTFDDLPLPPPLIEESQQITDRQTQAALITVTVANVAMSLIIIVAMILDGSKAYRAIIAGSIYFLVSTIVFSFIITGSLASILGRWARENTERQRIDAYRELGAMALEWRMMQEQALADSRRGSTGGVRRLSPLGDSPNYVSPYLEGDQAAHEAMRFAVSLYGADGRADPRKVQMVGADMGRLKVRMPGSKRGGGSREAGIWLLRQGIIQRVKGGFALNLLDFPTVEKVRRLL